MSMVEQTYRGTVVNGQIQWQDEPQLPDGTEVEITVITRDDDDAKPVRTLGDLLDSGVVGMWADRDDIEDGASFARTLRERASRRGGE
jgi:hypothetical protein